MLDFLAAWLIAGILTIIVAGTAGLSIPASLVLGLILGLVISWLIKIFSKK